jgi:hypothetical protein
MAIDIPDTPREPHFAAHCELQDAAKQATMSDAANSPAQASIEFAKFLTRFDTQIDDEWRATIVHIGGALIRLSNEMDDDAGPGARHE